MSRSGFDRTPQYYIKRFISHAGAQRDRLLAVQARSRTTVQDAKDTPHWVVCFYGVDRSLKYTARSLMQHIFKPLQKAGVRLTVVTHFNGIAKIAAGYSGEQNVDFSQDRAYLLNSDIFWIEPQTDASIRTELQVLEGVNWVINKPTYANAKWNLAHQLHSLDRVNTLIKTASLQDADVFAILRADLRFLDDLPVVAIQDSILSAGTDVITPDWGKWDGLNDRFAFLSRQGLQPIATRRHLLGDFAKEYGFIHSEQFMAYAARVANLTLGFTPMRAERVRGNGRVPFESFAPQ